MEIFITINIFMKNNKIVKKLLMIVDVTLQITDTRKFVRDTKWSPKISFKASTEKLLEEFRNL